MAKDAEIFAAMAEIDPEMAKSLDFSKLTTPSYKNRGKSPSKCNSTDMSGGGGYGGGDFGGGDFGGGDCGGGDCGGG